MTPAAELEEARILQPRLTHALFGHAEAERTLLDAYRSGRVPHAWLIGGERGIGKATLAYRMARFVLAHPDPSSPAVRNAQSLDVSPDHQASRRVANQAHSGLLVLRRVENERTSKLYTEIRVLDVRRFVPFFGSTAGEGGWRVAIVDPVDELNREGANALLKTLEEPPPRALLLLVCHAPGRVLPTIRSRCRTLQLGTLDQADVARALSAMRDDSPDAPDIAAAAAAADGSVSRALLFLESDALELRDRLLELLNSLPEFDPRALHGLGDRIAGTDQGQLEAFMDTVNAWLSERLRNGPQEAGHMARIAKAWETVNRAGIDADAYNLDRRPFVFSVFGALAEATRE